MPQSWLRITWDILWDAGVVSFRYKFRTSVIKKEFTDFDVEFHDRWELCE